MSASALEKDSLTQSNILTSLTSPIDRSNCVEGNHSLTLTDEEAQQATKELRFSFPRVEKTYCDPQYSNQLYSLHSFVPSKGAIPDKDGIFGMIKCRGAFSTLEEADKRAEWIIRNCDSFHPICTTYVGRPFPFCVRDRYSEDVNEIDLKKKINETMTEDLKQKKENDEKEIRKMKEREKNLLETSRKNQENNKKEEIIPEGTPIDQYIMLRTKRAQLIYTYFETKKKMDQMKENIKKVEEEIKESDETNPSFLGEYRERFMQARREVNIPDNDESFIKFLGDDIKIEF